jgi:hypothetical protein
MKIKLVPGIFLLLFSVMSCTKIEDPVIVEEILNPEKLVAVSHPVYGIDSLFYKNNFLSSISGYKYKGSRLIPGIRYNVVRNGDNIEISNQSMEDVVNTFYFKDSLLTEISGRENNLKAYFHYQEGKLLYFTYSGYDYVNNTPAGSSRDSLTVSYDVAGKNISELKWYRKDETLRSYELVYSTVYTFDDNLSPYKRSVYSLAKKWQGPDDIIVYFNSNNIVSTGSHMFYYVYDQNRYPVSVEFAVYGKTNFHYTPV